MSCERQNELHNEEHEDDNNPEREFTIGQVFIGRFDHGFVSFLRHKLDQWDGCSG